VFTAELSLQLNHVCNIITAEPAARNACKANLPSAVTFPVPNPATRSDYHGCASAGAQPRRWLTTESIFYFGGP
jgi:hypothetical protein